MGCNERRELRPFDIESIIGNNSVKGSSDNRENQRSLTFDVRPQLRVPDRVVCSGILPRHGKCLCLPYASDEPFQRHKSNYEPSLYNILSSQIRNGWSHQLIKENFCWQPRGTYPTRSIWRPLDFGSEFHGSIYASYGLSGGSERRRIRTSFTPSQLFELEERFQKSRYIVGEERKLLAKQLGLNEAQVKVWYQNRRTKYKHEKELEQLGGTKLAKRKAEHHVRKWQLETGKA